jgi:hypothetical protein
MQDLFFSGIVCNNRQQPDASATFFRQKHGTLPREQENGIDPVLVHGFSYQLDGDISPALEYLTQALRKVIQRKGELPARLHLAEFPNLVVTLDKSLGYNGIHGSLEIVEVQRCRPGKGINESVTNIVQLVGFFSNC